MKKIHEVYDVTKAFTEMMEVNTRGVFGGRWYFNMKRTRFDCTVESLKKYQFPPETSRNKWQRYRY